MHVFEYNKRTLFMTRGPIIPSQVQLNRARDQVGTQTMFERLKKRQLEINRPI